MAAKMSLGLARQQSSQLESALKQLQAKVATLVKKVEKEESERIVAENNQLKVEISALKGRLVAAEVANGITQVALPTKPLSGAAQAQESVAVDKLPAKPAQEPKKKKEKKERGKTETSSAAAEAPIDISRLNLRVGLIKEAVKHENADGLYVEQVDLGEEQPRTIVSGLVRHVPLEKMQNRLAVFMTNLKPAKMRGVLSQGMIMCASTPEKVEILDCPEGAKIGDRVFVKEYPGEPDAQLNPKKKIWEQVAPDLRVSSVGAATYKGSPLVVGDLGPLTAPSLRDVPIK